MNHPLIKQTGLIRRDVNGDAGMTPMIQRLEEERGGVLDFIERTVSAAQEAARDLTPSEQETLTQSRARVAAIDAQLEPMREFADLRSAHRQSAPGGGAPAPQGGGRGLGAQTEVRGHDYRTAGEVMADAWRSKNHEDPEAKRRLESIGRSIVGGRLEVSDLATARGVDSQYVSSLTGEARAAAPHVTTVEIPGVMPISIVGDIINDIDNARPFLNSIGVKDMSGIPGKTFTRPVVSEHVQVANQAAEKTAVQAGQFKIDDVDFNKSTEGGYVNVSRQSIDWSSPAMWDALLTDFLDIYGLHTENKAADAFVAAVQAGTDAVDTETAGANATIGEYIAGLYNGAVAVYTGSKRLPDHVWMSLDVWATMGIAIDTIRATTAGSGGGSSSLQDLQNGGVLTLPRTVVPSFPAGTLIVGRKNRVEAYEERLGFLSAVEPKLLGVELAYGGYFASGVLNADAFAELTFTEAV